MPFTGPLADRDAIHALHARYADATCRGDREAWIACWHADGAWDTAFGSFRGHADLRLQWDRLWTAIGSMAFAIDVDAIAVDGERATSQVRCREIVQMNDGAVHRYTARYDDELRKADGRWLFTRREYRTVFSD